MQPVHIVNICLGLKKKEFWVKNNSNGKQIEYRNEIINIIGFALFTLIIYIFMQLR